MNRILLLLMVLSIVGIGDAQISFPSDMLTKLKRGDVIVSLGEDEALNTALQEAVEEFWTYGKVLFLPKNEVEQKQDELKSSYLLTIDSHRASSLSSSGMASIGPKNYFFEIKNGKMLVIKEWLPSLNESKDIKVHLAFGFSYISYMFDRIIETRGEIQSRSDYFKYAKTKRQDIKNMTLYIREDQLHRKLSMEDIPSIYNEGIEVVDFETWKNAILNKQEGIIYNMIVNRNAGDGSGVSYHYLVGAENGRLFGSYYPKATFGGKKNCDCVNDVILEKYNEIIAGEK